MVDKGAKSETLQDCYPFTREMSPVRENGGTPAETTTVLQKEFLIQALYITINLQNFRIVRLNRLCVRSVIKFKMTIENQLT